MNFNDLISKLDSKQTLAMLLEIEKNYKRISAKIPAPKYDKAHRIKNMREIKRALKELKPQLDKVWDNNLEVINKYSKMTMTNNYIVFDLMKTKLNLTAGAIEVEKWNKIQDKLLNARQRKIKIQQVMQGNKNHLNKQVQKTVNEMYRDEANFTKDIKGPLNTHEYTAKLIQIIQASRGKIDAKTE